MKMLSIMVFLALQFSALVSCTSAKDLGSPKNPIKISLVPGQDVQILEENGKALESFLNKDTGLSFKLTVPTSFIAVVEALGSNRADLAIMNTFGYLLARDKYQAEARLVGLNQGSDTYRGQIIAHKDGPKKLSDLQNKKFAFVDPVSGSGFILPSKLIRDHKIKLKEYVFAGRHDSVVTMVYQKQVDAGATFHSNPINGEPRDARRTVIAQFPDVLEKIQIIEMTDSIPNDPIVFRKNFPNQWKEQIALSLKKYIHTEEGKKVMYNLYHMEDLRDSRPNDYDSIRSILKELGKNPEDLLK
jgi:phosphonate transport system substrate-binding protein